MASILIGYGIALACLGLVLRQAAPEFGRVASLAAGVAGGLNILWGVAAMAGMKRRAGAVLTTIPVAGILLLRTVDAWMMSASELSPAAGVRLLLTTMLLGTLAMLAYLLHGERPPEFPQAGAAARAVPPDRRGKS